MVGSSSQCCGIAHEHHQAYAEDGSGSPLEHDLRQILQTRERLEGGAEDLIQNRDHGNVCDCRAYPVHRVVGPGRQSKLAIAEKPNPIQQGEEQEVGSKEYKLPQQLTPIQQIDTQQLEN